VTIVRWFESNSALSVRMKPGINLSITNSATAKLLAAYLPREKTEALVRQELSEKGTVTQKDLDKVYAGYEVIRKSGIASSMSARQSGLNALSVPLFDQLGQVTAAITILGMSPQFEADPKSPAAKLLRTLGKELSAQLGAAAAEF
jgi:DNA-binding IclR family transcriptional regulator